ncbi:hypothetical protein TrVE_jg5423 [Triparma verrucosa]|uniref:Rab-GAP TBC domain-containing protein n=1 Tax=Triparma verrucosa TaxID=1606542 RepID=A0A9W7C8E9_9STRA|nr:hypothetical protein TrVE_jg5423 [Triparma verrucosa]
MLRKLTQRDETYTERSSSLPLGTIPRSLQPSELTSEIISDEGYLSSEDEGDETTKSNFTKATEQQKQIKTLLYKEKQDEKHKNATHTQEITDRAQYNPNNNNRVIPNPHSNGSNGTSSKGVHGRVPRSSFDINVDDDSDSDEQPDDEQTMSDLERDSSGNFLDERKGEGTKKEERKEEEEVVEAQLTDKYGFIIDSKNSTGSSGGARTTQVQISDKEKARRAETEALRTTKWLAMIKDWDLIKSKKRTRNRIRKGVPDKVRGLVWNLLGDVPNLKSSNPGKYASLCESTHVPSQDIRDTILRDINRTFPRHAMFADEGTGQDCLRRVLIAYSLYDEEVGYCQGLGFITAMFLTYMPEEEAFWQLVGIMNHSPCNMRGLYEDGMPEAQKVLYIAEKITKKFFPRLSKHLGRQNCHISMYATQWFLTIFTNSFPFDLVVQVWDCFLSEGWKIVYRVMLTFMRYSAPKLFQLEFEQIMFFFKRLPGAVDGPLIMEKAFNIPLKTRHIEHYSKKFDKLNPDIANRVQIKEQMRREEEEKIRKEVEEAEQLAEGGVLKTTLSLPS